MTRKKISSYNSSVAKKVFDYSLGVILFLLSIPLMTIISLIMFILNSGPVIFSQERVGKGGKVFTMYKFRTMRKGAEKKRDRLLKLNEVDGPVFKIFNDPRYTKMGKVLARTGLDELPQLLNVLRGEMSLIGPRPLPTYEARLLTKQDRVRQLVLPGITSSWIISGSHQLKFSRWMQLDRKYVLKATLGQDISILIKTGLIIIKSLLSQLV